MPSIKNLLSHRSWSPWIRKSNATQQPGRGCSVCCGIPGSNWIMFGTAVTIAMLSEHSCTLLQPSSRIARLSVAPYLSVRSTLYQLTYTLPLRFFFIICVPDSPIARQLDYIGPLMLSAVKTDAILFLRRFYLRASIKLFQLWASWANRSLWNWLSVLREPLEHELLLS